MKLATYGDGSRDGQLVVVARDLGSAHYAAGIATRLQQALDDWNFIAPQLQDLSERLNAGRARHAFAFEPRRCLAPLPRAFHWTGADGAALAGDRLLGPADGFDAGAALEVAAGIAALTGDLPAGVAPETALEGVRLLVLGATLRRQGPDGVREAGLFAPLALTPDELGAAWHGGRVRARLVVDAGGQRLAEVALADAPDGLGERLAVAAATRPLGAGAIVAVAGWRGRVEADALRVEVVDDAGASAFGALEAGARA